MSSTCEYGYTRLIPEPEEAFDVGNNEEIYLPPKYPYRVPEVYIEGVGETYYPQIMFDWDESSIIVVNDKLLTKYTKSSYAELLAEDEKGEVIWVDGRNAPYEGCWGGKYLGEARGAQTINIKEINLETLEKKCYKVILESVSTMDLHDFDELVDYIDPNIIKRIDWEKEKTKYTAIS